MIDIVYHRRNGGKAWLSSPTENCNYVLVKEGMKFNWDLQIKGKLRPKKGKKSLQRLTVWSSVSVLRLGARVSRITRAWQDLTSIFGIATGIFMWIFYPKALLSTLPTTVTSCKLYWQGFPKTTWSLCNRTHDQAYTRKLRKIWPASTGNLSRTSPTPSIQLRGISICLSPWKSTREESN